MGKVKKGVNWAKLVMLGHSEPLSGQNLEYCELGKIAALSQSEPLWWKKIGKVANQVKLAILNHFGGKRLEKL